ncbi:hypothetical protein ACQ2H7_003894 [Candidozyma auris]
MDESGPGYTNTHHTSILKLHGRPRSKSVDTSNPETQGSIPTGSPLTPNADQRSGSVSSVSSSSSVPVKPVLHRSTFSNGKSTSSPIILPPLLGPQPSKQPVKLSVPVSKAPPGTAVPLSPHGNAAGEPKDARIKGPLWTVPYEMPNSSSHGSDGSATNSRTGSNANSRRSSVDSVSSISTTGSRSRFGSLKSAASMNTEMAISDSDDDYYSTRSRAYSASLSPRNSVSSLSSLNGKLNRSLDLNSAQPPPPIPQQVTPQPTNHYTTNGQVALPFNSLEHNINLYYTSLSYGSSSSLPNNYDLFIKNLALLLPSDASYSPFYYNVQASIIINDLVNSRAEAVLSGSNKPRYKESWTVKTSPSNPTNSMVPNFVSLFVSLVKDKYELHDNLQEVLRFFENHPPAAGSEHIDESIYEAHYDYQLKISRLLKKLTQSLLNFDNYISTIYANNKSMTSAQDLIGPFFNLSYGQSFKLIKACKILVDPLIKYASDNELYTRSMKIIGDLSIAYNLLISNVNNNLNAITNSRNALNSQAHKYVNLSPSTSTSDSINVSGLGSTSIALILSKIDHHKLSFNNTPGPPTGDSSKSRVEKIEAWRREVTDIIVHFIQREDVDGWY